jgi:hypothetical protein
MGSVKSWFQSPYSPDMDVWRWILFIVFVLIVAAGWAHTVHFIARASE